MAHAAEAKSGAGQPALIVEVTVVGEESWKRDQDWRKAQIQERYFLEIPLTAGDALEAYNMLDPRTAERLQRFSTDVDARRRKIEAAAGRSAGDTPGVGGAAQAAEIQKRVDGCAGDEVCLRRVGKELASQHRTSARAATGSSMEEVRAACASKTGDAYERCVERQFQAKTEPKEPTEEPEARFRRYFPVQNCRGRVEASISREGAGQVADVAGTYQSSDYVRGKGALLGPALEAVCLGTQAVVDVKAGTLYVPNWAAPTIEVKTRVHVPPDGPVEGSETAGPSPEVVAWVESMLKDAPLIGQASTTITAPPPSSVAKGVSSRTLKVIVLWHFRAA
ncbi:MAG TPA: hypothetical protein VED40_00880 [Azospirillaceae bacterium]|nr:hypothetical protein [Azospirillaceae bacterium]